MEHIEFNLFPVDPDIWMRPGHKRDGSEYWEYVLLYNDDILVVSEHSERLLREQFSKYFELKRNQLAVRSLHWGITTSSNPRE